MSTTLYENIPAAQLGIKRIEAWEAIDSRTNPTLGCRVTLEDGSLGRAFVPSHPSMASLTMIDLRDELGHEMRQCGNPGISWAVERIREFNANARGVGAYDIEQQLGGPSNVSLAVSMAMAQAVAVAANKPLWQILDTSNSASLPCPMVTIFEGVNDPSAAKAVDDFLVVPLKAASFAEAVDIIWEVRRVAAELVEGRYGRIPQNFTSADGNLIALSGDSEEALELLSEAIEMVDAEIGIAIHMSSDRKRRVDEVLPALDAWCAKYPIVAVEDPLDANDWEGWAELSHGLGKLQLIGNEIFATNADRVKRAADNGIANSVLVKPKRIGTLSGAYETLWYSKSVGYRTIVSAQSADSEDSTIADLAVGWNAGQIKIGSIMRSERVAKYNRLLEIEDTYDLPYAGWRP